MSGAADNLFDQLRDIGFDVRLKWSIATNTAGTTKEQTICRYVAGFRHNDHRVVLFGNVYVIGDATFVSARILSTSSCRDVLVVPEKVSSIDEGYIRSLAGSCRAVSGLG